MLKFVKFKSRVICFQWRIMDVMLRVLVNKLTDKCKVFQAISEFVRGNMEPCRWKFDQIMLRGISKQQTKGNNASYSFK